MQITHSLYVFSLSPKTIEITAT